MKSWIDSFIFVLSWYTGISLMFLLACFLEKLLLYLVRRNLLNLKCLEDKRFR